MLLFVLPRNRAWPLRRSGRKRKVNGRYEEVTGRPRNHETHPRHESAGREPTEHAEYAEAGYRPVTKSMTERGFSPGACYLVTECTEAEESTQRSGASRFSETEWSTGSPAATPHALSLLRALAWTDRITDSLISRSTPVPAFRLSPFRRAHSPFPRRGARFDCPRQPALTAVPPGGPLTLLP